MPGLALDMTRDDVSPSLARLSSAELQQRILLAVGTVIATIAQRSFDEPGLRPKPWPARKSGGSHPLLIESGTLRQGIHARLAGSDRVEIRTSPVYAAVHQLGSSSRKIPARPFFPVLDEQLTQVAKTRADKAVERLIAGAA